MNPLLAKAIEYAAHGYSIIPVRKNKIPLIPKWSEFQTHPADLEQIERWWQENAQANIGIVTGKISGITVVDIDTGGEKVTPLTAFPETFTVKTPTGGYHLYYQHEPAIGQTANTFPQFPHVDIRNDGGYVVAPPSKADYMKKGERITGSYSVLKNVPIAPFPIALFEGKKEPKEGKLTISKIIKGMPMMVEGDGRNVTMTKIVGKTLRLVHPKDYVDVAWPIILAANARFKTPLPEPEVKTIFESIAARELKKPLAEIEFVKDYRGNIISNVENVYRTLKADASFIDKFRFNVFTGTYETLFGKKDWEGVQRIDITRVRSLLMSNYEHFARVSFSDTEDAMHRASEDQRISPPAEWMASLIWDGKTRLDTWLHDTYGVPKDKYHKAIGANVLKGIVLRAVRPGSKFDYVLVIEGKQGIKKSTSLAILGGAWHVETVLDPGNKDFYMMFSGKLIVEFAEGETLNRAATKQLKAIITMQYDKYRPPYERAPKEFPRQCVFMMTTNQEQYLKDETGNRRWLPIRCERIVDVEWLKENREQLFAEAYHRVITKGETVHEFPQEETEYQQSLRQTTDPREDMIFNWYWSLDEERQKAGVSTHNAYVEALKHDWMDGKTMDRLDEMVIGSIMRDAMHLERKRGFVEGERAYRFYPTKESMKLKPEVLPKQRVKGPTQTNFKSKPVHDDF